MTVRFSRLLRSLNGDGAYGSALLLCLGLIGALGIGSTRWLALLRYERSGLEQGQYWRLLSAHLVHLNAHHLLLNVLGLLLLWVMFARDLRPRDWLVVALASIGAIDAGLWFISTQVLWYVGASGVLHGLWAAGAVASWRAGSAYGVVLSCALAAKLCYEHFAGPNPLDVGLPVITIAHIYGALGGALAAVVFARAPRRL
jgi:rhomboid family GlyGly-CTERM serine protease